MTTALTDAPWNASYQGIARPCESARCINCDKQLEKRWSPIPNERPSAGVPQKIKADAASARTDRRRHAWWPARGFAHLPCSQREERNTTHVHPSVSRWCRTLGRCMRAAGPRISPNRFARQLLHKPRVKFTSPSVGASNENTKEKSVIWCSSTFSSMWQCLCWVGMSSAAKEKPKRLVQRFFSVWTNSFFTQIGSLRIYFLSEMKIQGWLFGFKLKGCTFFSLFKLYIWPRGSIFKLKPHYNLY